jgi:hypothetical protein
VISSLFCRHCVRGVASRRHRRICGKARWGLEALSQDPGVLFGHGLVQPGGQLLAPCLQILAEEVLHLGCQRPLRRAFVAGDRRECVRHLARGRRAILGLPGHKAFVERDQRQWQLGAVLPSELWRTLQGKLAEHVHLGSIAPHSLAHDGLVEHGAHGEEIAPSIERIPERLLGGHVADLALHLAGAREPLITLDLCDPEIQELHVALRRDHDVLRRHVAMNHVKLGAVHVRELVNRREPFAHHGQNVSNQRRRQPLTSLA